MIYDLQIEYDTIEVIIGACSSDGVIVMSSSKFNWVKLEKNLEKFFSSFTPKSSEQNTSLTSGKGYYFWYSEILLADVVESIISDSKIGKLFSWKELGQLILKLSGEGISNGLSQKKIISNIIRHIKQEPTKFFCIIPIHGVKLSEPYNIGNVTLYPADEKESVIKENVKDNIYDQLIDTLKNTQDFATVSVDAIIPAGAIEIALPEVKSALNILKFLVNTPMMLYQLGIGKQSKTMFDNEFVAVSEDNGLTQHPFQYMPIPVDLNDFTDAIKPYITKIGEIQRKIYTGLKTVPLEKGIVNAINLIAEGLDEERMTLQLIQFMLAIEALVEQKTFVQGITDQVCERTALLLGKDSEMRKLIYNKLSNLYEKRSNLSHGNTAVVTHYDLIYLWKIARELCFYFLIHFEEFVDSNSQEKKKLKEYLLELRFESGE